MVIVKQSRHHIFEAKKVERYGKHLGLQKHQEKKKHAAAQ